MLNPHAPPQRFLPVVIACLLINTVAVTVSVMAAETTTAGSTPAAGTTPATPNIIFILCDDLGWRDPRCFGSTFHETPNIDRLAARGLKLTQAYSASPLCSPTRCSILTGLYPARIGITAPNCHLPTVQLSKRLTPNPNPSVKVINADSLTRLKTEYTTLAEHLHTAGYRTAHFGKWHLGHGAPYEPIHQGFDVDFPHTPRAAGPGGGYLAPWSFINDPPLSADPGTHIEERMADEAAQFIHAHREQPFFLNYWAFSVHSPWNAPQDDIEYFQKTADTSNPQHNPLYAAMVRRLDNAVGRLLQAVDDSGIADNTIIVFFSDNGGWAYPPRNTDPPGFESVPATSNLPLRSGKASLYEGGTRVPCIITWPGKIPAGQTSQHLFQSLDFAPTLLQLCGISPPQDTRFDGVDQSSLWLSGTSVRDFVFCHFPHGSDSQAQSIPGFLPGSSLRNKDWKLIRFYGQQPDGSDQLELYNLADDPSESRNMNEARPEITAALLQQMDTLLQDTEAVIPHRNPAWDPAARTPDKQAKNSAGRKPVAPTEKEDPLLLGWKLRGCRGQVLNDALQVTEQQKQPFLGFAIGSRFSRSTLHFRIRCSAGQGRVEWLPKPDQPELAKSVPWTATDSSDWQDVEVQLPADRPLGILRLYLPLSTDPIAIDHIRLSSPERTESWDFQQTTP
ncbi:MAG: hypothetical protein RLZZ232_2793 [Planctomycetota bacterium]